jgi:hypothetical protein
MLLRIAQLLKRMFIRMILTEINRQSKAIRQSNEKVALAYEAVDRMDKDEQEKKRLKAERIAKAQAELEG